MIISSIFQITYPELQAILLKADLPKYAADQIYNWIYKKYDYEPQNWPNVSKKVKSFLISNFDFFLPNIVNIKRSKDGTTKFLIEFEDKKTVESVIIPGEKRYTICVSSQVGCAIGCKFCLTANMGFVRHLTAGEVVAQYVVLNNWLRENVNSDQKISNIVYMGQGEPLHNFDNMKDATLIFMEPKGLGIGQRKITLSTSGLVPQIEKLNDFPPINIAISLHSVFDHKRSELMPINVKYDLGKLFKAISHIHLKAQRKVTYEYLLIDNFNDQQEDIDKLSEILIKKESKINIIPFNEYEGAIFKRPSEEKIKWFNDQLIKKGFVSTIRLSKGDDVMAACGQLTS